MKISPYLKINRIEFMVTYQCSGHCKHCSVVDRLNRSDKIKHISEQSAVAVVKELSEIFPISSVMTFGGEPLLYADVVCAIHEAASRCGIGARQLITNGYFTKDYEKCRQTVTSLSEAGINDLLISVDAFHQETIPIEAVRNFARYTKEAGTFNIKLHPAWVVNEQNDNPYNSETRGIIEAFSDFVIPVSTGNNIFLAGNATKYLARFYDKPRLNLSDSCGSMPYTEPLTNITSLSIVPNGDVMICGFAIGNIHEQSIQEIVAKYDPYENECMNAVLTGGASALLELSKQRGISVDCSQCYSVCNLCHKINTALLN